jgi:hypothetical protein
MTHSPQRHANTLFKIFQEGHIDDSYRLGQNILLQMYSIRSIEDGNSEVHVPHF